LVQGAEEAGVITVWRRRLRVGMCRCGEADDGRSTD
jgi:hypothetical protein